MKAKVVIKRGNTYEEFCKCCGVRFSDGYDEPVVAIGWDKFCVNCVKEIQSVDVSMYRDRWDAINKTK